MRDMIETEGLLVSGSRRHCWYKEQDTGSCAQSRAF